MAALRGFCNKVIQIYGPLFPTPRRKRNMFLGGVRDRVAFYKPRIEGRCGVELGDVSVKDNREWLPDFLTDHANTQAMEYAWKDGRVPTEHDFIFSYVVASTAEILAFIPVCMANNLRGTQMRHYNNTLYVPFSFINRYWDPDFKKRRIMLDYTVIHELSHSLWKRLGGPPETDECRLLFEGFATFCAEDYFADLYPEDIEPRFEEENIYTKGKRRIEELVGTHGREILLEIPGRCEEFSAACRTPS